MCTKPDVNVKQVTEKCGHLVLHSDSRLCVTILHLTQMQYFSFVDTKKIPVEYLTIPISRHDFHLLPFFH
jgi:hypothetical protein